MTLTLVSAHRAGSLESGLPEGSRESLLYAMDLDVDFIEFDVQRFSDGVHSLAHDEEVMVGGSSYPSGTISSQETSSSSHL